MVIIDPEEIFRDYSDHIRKRISSKLSLESKEEIEDVFNEVVLNVFRFS